ncbi:Hypothetical predicted protein [Mytilus galloprovincialis]|uniref:PiggyBac transposable element-derived protein domain-containing protein n=1 Tax=Mytilus galloprovincialis TaxID=29158 RepID=A0A8B6C605_MYTGA|nr:Hypothetical predicted protein [Mytilus galloprovincialis]
MAAIEPNPWFRVLPPEPMNDPPFNGAPTGPINMPPRDAAPIAYFYLLFSIDLIKEFVKQTNRKFLRFYNPRRELAVDEFLVGTKGKTSMLQYIPSKRSRFGVKFWMLVESVIG